MSEKILIFDSHNLMFRKVFSAHRDKPLDVNFNYFKTILLRDVFETIKKFKPTKVIFAIDAKNNWRKQIYSEYKNKRSKARAKSLIDFDKFFKVVEEFYDDLENTFTNMYFIKEDQCEGDDIIAVLVKNLSHSIIAISTDKDMHQLNKHRHYKQFDPIKRKIIESLNPKKELQIKILTGDASDNIPGIKSRFGIVSAQKAMEDLDKFLNENKLNEVYERNRKLIDLDLIPEDLKLKILNAYNNYDIEPYQSRKIVSMLNKHGLEVLFCEMQNVLPVLQLLR